MAASAHFVPSMWDAERWTFGDTDTLQAALAQFPDNVSVIDVRVTAGIKDAVLAWLDKLGATHAGHVTADDAPADDLTGSAETWAIKGAALRTQLTAPACVTPADLYDGNTGDPTIIAVAPSGCTGLLRACEAEVGRFRVVGDLTTAVTTPVLADNLWRASNNTPPENDDVHDSMWFGPRQATGEPEYVSRAKYTPGSRPWRDLCRFLGDCRADIGLVCTAETKFNSALTVFDARPWKNDDARALVTVTDGRKYLLTVDVNEHGRPAFSHDISDPCEADSSKLDLDPTRLVAEAEYGGDVEYLVGGIKPGVAGRVVAARQVPKLNGFVTLELTSRGGRRQVLGRLYQKRADVSNVESSPYWHQLKGEELLSRLPTAPINYGWPLEVRGLTAQQWLRGKTDRETRVVLMLFTDLADDVRAATLRDVVRVITENAGCDVFVFQDDETVGCPDQRPAKKPRREACDGAFVLPGDWLRRAPVPTGALSVYAASSLNNFRSMLQTLCTRRAPSSGRADLLHDISPDAKQALLNRTTHHTELRYSADVLPASWFDRVSWWVGPEEPPSPQPPSTAVAPVVIARHKAAHAEDLERRLKCLAEYITKDVNGKHSVRTNGNAWLWTVWLPPIASYVAGKLPCDTGAQEPLSVLRAVQILEARAPESWSVAIVMPPKPAGLGPYGPRAELYGYYADAWEWLAPAFQKRKHRARVVLGDKVGDALAQVTVWFVDQESQVDTRLGSEWSESTLAALFSACGASTDDVQWSRDWRANRATARDDQVANNRVAFTVPEFDWRHVLRDREGKFCGFWLSGPREPLRIGDPALLELDLPALTALASQLRVDADGKPGTVALLRKKDRGNGPVPRDVPFIFIGDSAPPFVDSFATANRFDDGKTIVLTGDEARVFAQIAAAGTTREPI